MKAWSPSSLRSLGVALTVISLALTAWQASAFAPEIRNDVFDMGLFWVQHGIALVYFILIVIHNASTKGFRKLFHFDPFMYSLALIIYSLGAHSLNYFTEIQVFAPYVTWMKGYLLLMHLAILAFPFRKKLPESFQYLLYFICGAGVLMGAYMTVFIAPLMPFAAALVWFYGFSVYALVPLFYLIYFIRSYFKMELLPHTRRAFWAGILVPVAVFFVFALRWQGVQRTIKEVRQDYQANYTQQYPEWVTLAQRLPTDPLTERVVKGDAFTQRSFWDDFGGSTLSRNIIRKQDPLATLAGLVYGHFEFYDDDLLRLLESRYRLRHETHRRLWRGDQLVTTRVESNIELYPEYRLGYTEMTLEVKNTHSWDENQQEAVYSFHLPDGAAVTSLSLWIEGKEEFSRLSTRSKADAAYVQIVGRERRDPALVHWQEGNRITVTVFPCTPQEDRRFKLGFSYPLVYENEELVLSQIYFEGPPAARAHETVTIHLNGEDSNIAQLPNRFHQKDPHTFTYSGYYRPQWKLSLKAPALSSASFSFLGKHYSTHTLEPITQPFDPTTIVLDINAAWKKTDFEAIWPWIKDKKVQVFIPHPVEMTAANREEMFAYLHQNHFSLLPLHQIADPANTLVVSQSTSSAPLLSDLEHTIFASEFEQYMVAQPGEFSMVQSRNPTVSLCPIPECISTLGLCRRGFERIGRNAHNYSVYLLPTRTQSNEPISGWDATCTSGFFREESRESTGDGPRSPHAFVCISRVIGEDGQELFSPRYAGRYLDPIGRRSVCGFSRI